jgi:hypothetical protein
MTIKKKIKILIKKGSDKAEKSSALSPPAQSIVNICDEIKLTCQAA